MLSMEQLSDKQEDQYARLNEAVKYLLKKTTLDDNLLKNEYLIRKFEPDPINPNYYLLRYESVQRENSIKSQYVQNENNDRRQYHQILTSILLKHHLKLWEFDQPNLCIRPYFPSERKRVQIKLQATDSAKLQELIQQEGNFQLDEQQNHANISQVKLYVTAQNEESAQKLFAFLRSKKEEYRIDSVMMQNIDYLDDFQKQLNQKKLDMLQQRQAEYYRHDPPQPQEFRKPKGRGYDDFRRGNNRQQYVQKQSDYQLVPKKHRGGDDDK